MQRNRGVRRAEAFALSRARRFATTAARRARGFVRKNPFTAGTFAGSAANDLLRGVKRYSRKGGLKGKRKARRIGPAAKPPTTPSARISAKYAVAPTMTKFKKAKLTAQKVPKSVICHYKDFGRFNAEKCMYINHEHWGNVDRVWYGIALGLAKMCLAKARIYPGKSFEDPMIGPRTSYLDPGEQYDNKSFTTQLRLIFCNEGTAGQITREATDIDLEAIGASPDTYRSLDGVAQSIVTALVAKYNGENKTWLQEAQIRLASDANNQLTNALPVYIQNLDDAEIHFYANSLIKFQNVTEADHGPTVGNMFDKSAIDSNPLIGRVFTGKGHHPVIDGDLASMGDRTLDSFFGNVNTGGSSGITLLGHAGTHTADDLGRIRHIPKANEIYGNQSVKTGQIRIGAGAMKYHKTSFTMKKTFKALADVCGTNDTGQIREDMFNEKFGSHTMFGLTLEHKHGEDSIKLGFNRDIDIGCYIKHSRVIHPLKTNYTLDQGVLTTGVVPTDHVHAP